MVESDTQAPVSVIPQEAIRTAFALHREGRAQEAETLYRTLLDRDPSYDSALFGLGLLRLQQGRFEEARGLTRRALDRRPNWAEAHGNLGSALMALGRHQEAAESFSRAIAGNPALVQAHCDLASALHALCRYEEAVSSGERALALSPDCPEAHAHIAASLLPLNRFDEALVHAQRALELRPENLGVYSLLGVVLRSMNRPREAIAMYDRALTIKPGHAEAHWNQSLARLTEGDFDAGWKQFEWRWRNPALRATRRHATLPVWLGETSLEGKTLLIHAEQGFGDTIQFARYVTLAAERAAQIVIEVPRPLVSLLSNFGPNVILRAEGEALPPFDCFCSFMSLPLAFGTRLDTIPAAVPYLSAAPDRAAIWRDRLVDLPGLRVGLVWAGAPRPGQASANAIDRRRSVSLERYGRLASIPGISFVSLQKGEGATQTRSPTAGMQIHDWTDELSDFAETAALIEALDLVISVDTAVVHLAGALGKPVWMLNRFDTCWRWLLDRDDSPWYPTLRQFRQQAPGDWDAVLDAVAAALTLVSSARPSCNNP